MIYIYNRNNWSDARRLAEALRSLGVSAKRIRRPVMLTDRVVNWGFRHPGGAALNGPIIGNKLKELEKLKEGGVRVPPFSLEPRSGYIARCARHRSGSDLLANLMEGDFYVKKLEIVKEFRLHIFRDKSIRLGLKIPDENYLGERHPWIRSLKTGWKISYGRDAQDAYVEGVKHQAKKAIAALRYDFGAVDVGVTEQNKVYVFEVNSAPGLHIENTASAYARHIAEVLE